MALSKITNASVADTAVHGRRNHIINGNFHVWQRSEDRHNTLNVWAYYSADRFVSNKGRFRKTTDTVDGRTVNVLQIDPSSGVYNGGRGVFTRIEDWNVYDKKTTLSVWVKADAATTANLGRIWDYGTSSNANVGRTINVTTSWQRFTITYDAQTFTQAAGQYLIGGLVDGRTYYVAMAQLEDGEIATPFEHARSYGEELSLCQRYYQTIIGIYQYVHYVGTSNAYVRQDRALPVTMRVTPTGTGTFATGGSAVATNNSFQTAVDRCGYYCQVTGAGGDTGRVAYNNITLDAELSV